MAKILGPLHSISAAGSFGPRLTFSNRKSGQQCRIQKAQVYTPNTAQQTAREAYATAYAGWNALSEEEKQEYKDRAKSTMTGYNLYMKENISITYSEQIDQEQTGENAGSFNLGDANGTEYREAQSFQISGNYEVTAIGLKQGVSFGSPSGNWTIRIETDNENTPSGTLANENATFTAPPPGVNTEIKCTFLNRFALSSGTKYWIVMLCDNQSTNVRFGILGNNAAYALGQEASSADGIWTARPYDLFFKVYVLKP